MQVYTDDQLKHGLAAAIKGGRQADSDILEDRLLALIRTIERTAFCAGRREVQDAIKRGTNSKRDQGLKRMSDWRV